jgi:hypothetical protein
MSHIPSSQVLSSDYTPNQEEMDSGLINLANQLSEAGMELVQRLATRYLLARYDDLVPR